MPIYKYVAINKLGDECEEIEKADNLESIFNIVASRGGVVKSCRKIHKRALTIKNEDLILFLNHLKFQHDEAFFLIKSIENFVKICESLPLRFRLKEALLRMRSGWSIHESFGEIFDGTLSGFLFSLEKTGDFNGVIDSMIGYINLKMQTKTKLLNRIKYPLFLFAFTTAILMTFVQFLMPMMPEGAGDMGMRSFLLLYKVSLGVAVLFVLLCCCSEKFIVSNPITSKTIIRLNNWYFSMNFYVNLKSKLSLITSLKNAAQSVPNARVRQDFSDLSEGLGRGSPLVELVRDKAMISSALKEFIIVGELSNNFLAILSSYNQLERMYLLSKIDTTGRAMGVGLTLVSGTILIAIMLGVFVPIYSSLFSGVVATV